MTDRRRLCADRSPRVTSLVSRLRVRRSPHGRAGDRLAGVGCCLLLADGRRLIAKVCASGNNKQGRCAGERGRKRRGRWDADADDRRGGRQQRRGNLRQVQRRAVEFGRREVVGAAVLGVWWWGRGSVHLSAPRPPDQKGRFGLARINAAPEVGGCIGSGRRTRFAEELLAAGASRLHAMGGSQCAGGSRILRLRSPAAQLLHLRW